MSSFSLFHQPSFGAKVQGIKNLLHLKALFAAMFSFSARFEPGPPCNSHGTPRNSTNYPSHQYFHALATKFVQEALDECADDVPPLCVLQALVLSTFYRLTNGVRSRAWLLLGSCVRIAYELRLHLVDYEGRADKPKAGIDLRRWLADEERRRCWWAIWEMDVFASTIRRCPTAIDWTMIDTCLPVEDKFWFNNEYHPSCFLERRPMARWKRLKRSGNESASAWFIVIYSLMRNAQALSRGNLQGILPESDLSNSVAQLVDFFRNAFRKKCSEEDSMQLAILLEALRCATAVLPEKLAYKGEVLSFAQEHSSNALKDPDKDHRRLDCAKFSIHMVTQLARFMVYHHYAFGEIETGTLFAERPHSPDLDWSVMEQETPTNCEGLRNVMMAADNILALISRSADNHVQYVNPFLSSTVWLATSLQIFRKALAPDAPTESTETKCRTLRLCCQRYAEFWDTPSALLENLDTLEERLISRRNFSAQIQREEKKRRRTGYDAPLSSLRAQCLGEQDRGQAEQRQPEAMSLVGLDGMFDFQTPPVGRTYNPGVPFADSGPYLQSPTDACTTRDLAQDPSSYILGQGETSIIEPPSPNPIDSSSYLTPDPMFGVSGSEDDFAWYLAGLMSESMNTT